MRVGVAGVLPLDLESIDEAAIAGLRELGLSCTNINLRDPLGADDSALVRVREVVEGGGLTVAQANPQYGTLASDDPEIRKAGVAALRRACRCARILGAPNVYVRPGGRNTRGDWWPHPENRSPETFDRVVAALRAVAPAASDEGVVLAVEGHVLSPLYSIGRVADLFDAVGSDTLGFNADPVNFVGSIDQAYASRTIVDEIVNKLGSRVACVHVKDYQVLDKLVLHIEECTPGDGVFDLEYFFKKMEASWPDVAALIEHLPLGEVARAKHALDSMARAFGSEWRQ